MPTTQKIFSGDNELLAQIVDFSCGLEDGVQFYTDDNANLQCASMKHSAGTKIRPHVHINCKRNISNTSEALVILKGRLKAAIYDKNKKHVTDLVLVSGQIALFFGGGHGFEVLDDLEMYEIKQGPYVKDADKERFND